MEKFSVKVKLIILILLICGFILLLDNYVYAGCSSGCKNFDIIAYQRVLIINGNNETKYKVRDGVVKLPFTNKTGSAVEWRSSNSNIAIVNQYGYVTGLNPGNVTITARTKDGKHLDTCKVFVRYNGDKIVATAGQFARYNGETMLKIFSNRTGNQDYYRQGYQWCALFVSYCYDMNYAVARYKSFNGYKSRVFELIEAMPQNYKSKAQYPNYIPKKGDIAIIDEGTPDSRPDHVGIVTLYNSRTNVVYTIEGNVSPGTSAKTRIVGYRNYYNYYPYKSTNPNSTKDYRIMGYISLNNGL